MINPFRRFKYFKYKFQMVKEAIKFYPWDYTFNLIILKASIEQTRNYIRDHGIEVDEGRLQKVEAMEQSIYLLNNMIEDNFLDLAETELDLKLKYNDWDENEMPDEYTPIKENKVIYDKSTEIEKSHYNELFDLLKNDIRGWWD